MFSYFMSPTDQVQQASLNGAPESTFTSSDHQDISISTFARETLKEGRSTTKNYLQSSTSGLASSVATEVQEHVSSSNQPEKSLPQRVRTTAKGSLIGSITSTAATSNFKDSTIHGVPEGVGSIAGTLAEKMAKEGGERAGSLLRNPVRSFGPGLAQSVILDPIADKLDIQRPKDSTTKKTIKSIIVGGLVAGLGWLFVPSLVTPGGVAAYALARGASTLVSDPQVQQQMKEMAHEGSRPENLSRIGADTNEIAMDDLDRRREESSSDSTLITTTTTTSPTTEEIENSKPTVSSTIEETESSKPTVNVEASSSVNDNTIEFLLR